MNDELPSNFKADDILVIRQFDGGNPRRLALVVGFNLKKLAIRVRYERSPTQAELEAGNYDRWVKTITLINPDRVIGIAPGP